MNILITGCAGFIGFHLTKRLIENKKNNIHGIDNLNDSYDVKLKNDRLQILMKNKNFIFSKMDIINDKKLSVYFKNKKFKYVVHLAAKAGVRDSIQNPRDYLNSNIIGFFNVLDLSMKHKIKHLVYASTSSVYGETKKFPSNENDNTDSPVSFYAASKKNNEVLAYAYSSIYNIPTTGLRFFTVYGPYGRPDMAPQKFTNLISKNKKIDVYNHGRHIRDFTYIDDVVNSLLRLIDKPSQKKIPYNIFNIGSQKPKSVISLINQIELNLNKISKKKYLGFQKGDVYKTFADSSKLIRYIKYKPYIQLKEGIAKLIYWYKKYDQ